MKCLTELNCRWVGDAVSVTAVGRTVVKRRTNTETGQPEAVQVPDHVDILSEFAIGAQGHILISSVLGECVCVCVRVCVLGQHSRNLPVLPLDV